MCQRKKRKTQHRNLHQLFDEQGGKCFYCGQDMWIQCSGDGGIYHPAKATLDHILPRSRGGTYRMPNVLAACGQCNSHRGNTHYADYYFKVRSGGVPMNYKRMKSIKINFLAPLDTLALAG